MVALSEAPPAVVAVHKARAGDKAALDERDVAILFRRYAPYVARIGLRILGRHDEVDDLVQDVFLAAHRSLFNLREAGAVKGWLAAITVRAAHRRLRRRKLRNFFSFAAETPDYTHAVDATASPEERALIAAVFAALDRLPADQRVAWSLRHLEGETMERVAELCECSLSTAKRRVNAAQDALVAQGVVHV